MNDAPGKLPVWKTALESFRLTVRNFTTLLRFAWPWLLIFMAASAALYWNLYEAEQSALAAGNWGSPKLFYATTVLSTVIGAFIAIPWHRLLLVGEQPASPSLAIDRRHVMYALLTLALFALAPLPVLLADLVTAPTVETEGLSIRDAAIAAGVLGFVACWLVINRLSLVLPVIALDPSRASVREAWHITRGNTWRLFASSGLILLVIVPIFATLAVISEFFSGWNETQEKIEVTPVPSQVWFTAHSVLFEIAGITLGMLFVTFLSLAYRHFYGLTAPSEAAAH